MEFKILGVLFSFAVPQPTLMDVHSFSCSERPPTNYMDWDGATALTKLCAVSTGDPVIQLESYLDNETGEWIYVLRANGSPIGTHTKGGNQ